MRFNLKHAVFTVASVVALLVYNFSSAQSVQRNGYFLYGNIYRSYMNPAFAPDRNYLGLITGNAAIGTKTNSRLSDFFYIDNNGNWADFTGEGMSKEAFLTNISEHNPLNANISLPIISGGFWNKSGYFSTIDISLRSASNISIPYGIFQLIKENEAADGSYNLGGLELGSRNYLQLAYGMSAPVSEKFRIGARVKLLGGLAAIDAAVPAMDVNIVGNVLSVKGEGHFMSSSRIINIPTKISSSDPTAESYDFKNIQFDKNNIGLSGFGVGLDFGAEYKVTDWLEVSASIQDFGMASWSDRKDGEFSNSISVDFSSYHESEQDKVKKEIEKILEFKKVDSGKKGWNEMLPMTVMAGTKFSLPSYNKLSAGLLYTAHINKYMPWHEGRASLNFEPAKWFGISGSYALNTFGNIFGCAISITAPGLALFIGAETGLMYSQKVKIPTGKANIDITAGLNLYFGKSHKK